MTYFVFKKKETKTNNIYFSDGMENFKRSQMPREQVVVGLVTSKAAADGPDVSIRRFAGLNEAAVNSAPLVENDINVTLDLEEAESIVALADEQARHLGNQYLGAGDLSLAKSGDGINVHVAVQAWPQSALTFLAQLNQDKITALQRQPLMLYETWQNMLDSHMLVQTKIKNTVQSLERERTQISLSLEDEMAQTTQRSSDAQASLRDLRNCQNKIMQMITEIEDLQKTIMHKWSDDRLMLVTQGKLYFETMATQHKSGIVQIENKAQQHKFTTMPQLTKGWRDGARYLYDMLAAAFRQRIMPVLINSHYRDQLRIILEQNFMEQPGLTLNTLVMCFGELMKANVQTYKLQASAVYLPQAVRAMASQPSQTINYERIDVAATRQAMLFQAGGELIRQWCCTATMLQVNDSAAELVFRAAVMLSVLVDEAESVDTAIDSFHETDCVRNMQRVTAHRDQSISSMLERLHASVDFVDKALAENTELVSKQRKLSDWVGTWETIRNDMPAVVAALSPTQNKWFRFIIDEHKARLNRITVDTDVYAAQKILALLKGGV
jgi:hypothetical protein